MFSCSAAVLQLEDTSAKWILEGLFCYRLPLFFHSCGHHFYQWWPLQESQMIREVVNRPVYLNHLYSRQTEITWNVTNDPTILSTFTMNPLSKLLPINFLSIIKWTNSLNSSTISSLSSSSSSSSLSSSSIPIKMVTETTTINQIFPLTICLPSHYTIMQPYHSNRCCFFASCISFHCGGFFKSYCVYLHYLAAVGAVDVCGAQCTPRVQHSALK